MKRWIPCAGLLLALAGQCAATDWPMLRQNSCRTAYTPDDPKGPYEPKWARGDLIYENILCWVEPIVADGRVYLGTGEGNIFALDRYTGKTVWKTALGWPVMHSVAYHNGRIFTAVHGNWDGAFVTALDAATGKTIWTTVTPPGGFWTSPLVVDGLVILGSRNGSLYAFNETDGQLRWNFISGGPILSSAAARDGRVYFAAEDMRAYCVQISDGKGIWRSEPLDGKTFRGYSPVIWKDKLVLRSAPTITYAAYEVEGQSMYYEWAGWPRNYQGLPYSVDDKAINPAFRTEWKNAPDEEKDKYTYGAIRARKWEYFTPQRVRQESEALREKLRQRAALRTAFLLDLSDGVQRSVLPVTYASGCACPAVPPAVDGDENLYVLFKSFYSNWDTPIRAHDAVGRYDLRDQLVELIQFEPRDPKKNTQHTYFHITADETNHLTVAGNTLWNQHGTNGSRGWYVGAMDLTTRQFTWGAGGERESYPKVFGLSHAPRAGSSGQVGGTVVCDDQVFNLVSGVLTCIGPKASNSTTAPVVITEENPALAPAEVPVPKTISPWPRINAETVVGETLLARQAVGDDAIMADSVSRRLARLVKNTINNGPWAPWRLVGGQCSNELLSDGDQFYFAMPSEVFGALAAAYPHLDESLREEVRNYLSREWQRFRPWSNNVYQTSDPGTRYGQGDDYLRQRENYRLGFWLYGPQSQRTGAGGALARGTISPIANDYAIWLYANNLDQWEPVRAVWDQMKADANQFLESKATFAAGRLPHLNWHITGLIGYIRIARELGDQPEIEKAMPELQRLLDLRVALEVSSANLSRGIYRGVYDQMCPELWRYLLGAAGEHVHRMWLPCIEGRENEPKVAALSYAWGVGPHESRNQEAYVSPPSTVFAAFQARAYLYNTAPRQLRDDHLDMPWVKADLYYLLKLAMTLDAFGQAAWQPLQ